MQTVLSKYLVCVINHMMGTPFSYPLLNVHLFSLCFPVIVVMTIIKEGGRWVIAQNIQTDPNGQIFQSEANAIVRRYLPLPFSACANPKVAI